MIFLYSRKSQLLLLACWTIGMTFMYMQITGEKPLWLIKADQRITARHQKARLGQMPALPEPPPAPAPEPRPAADPEFNRFLDLRLAEQSGGPKDIVTLDLEYVAARNKGFTPEKFRSYYLEDAPTFVITLDEPWTSDIGNASFSSTLPQVSEISMIVSKSRTLRLLVHTHSMRVARGARAKLTPTAAGAQLRIDLPR